MLLIGSKALRHWVPTSRPGFDHDMLATRAEFDRFVEINKASTTHFRTSRDKEKFALIIAGNPVEIELALPGGSNEILMSLATGPKISVFGCEVQVADAATLYAVKRSHLNLPLNWWKHIIDYHKLKALKPELTSLHEKAWRMRRVECEARYKKTPKPNLMVSNEEFFGKSQKVVNRVFVHDDLHFSTCFYERPMYEKLKHDQSLAWCDNKLFNGLSHGDKIKCVQEEAFALALERKVVPAMNEGRTYSADLCFRHGVERIGTTLTSGWFREFTQENAMEILEHGVDYVGKFLSYLDKKEKSRE